ncbi:prephenate dehydratase [Candidatus Solincola tengchongensis]|uniref:prephenate dehydratase n=1 Tax=Candidatus Solincola tengchongensis TaxID=2900693 RepID=UPI00257CF12F
MSVPLSCRRVAYLGPPGTFTEEALLSWPDLEFEASIPFPTVEEAILAVQDNLAEKAVVPIENSLEGSVNATLDCLAFEADVFIQAEKVCQVRHCLLARPGVGLEEVARVISHPQAAAQCRRHLIELLPGVEVEAANSTSEAARRVAESGEPLAALGSALAAELYGLQLLREGMEDHPENRTRFVLLGREKMPPSGRDKTSMVCFIHQDRPGMLLQILQEFAYRYINLSKIESRPTKKSLGEYCFFIDCEGHEEDEVVASALKCLRCKLPRVKLLGSYPAYRED